MLFVQNDLRVKSASYSILPFLEFYPRDRRLDHLSYLHDIVAYFYAAPHDVFENVFLPPEEISLALFTPSHVSSFLTRPGHHTEWIGPTPVVEADKFHRVPGYNGLYNFRHAFWVEPGSRLYGPKPHMTLNISQDLYLDFEQRMNGQPGYDLLLKLLEESETPASLRIYSALSWYNAANKDGLGQSHAILNLAIAFEALLRLPESSKTDRLVDAISLLLGRTERLDLWAEQFYAARSQVAHEGIVREGYFNIHGKSKGGINEIFGSLLLYGRQIFQLCVGTILVGIDLAKRADLQEKFITNNERYQKICDVLRNNVTTPNERLLSLNRTIRSLERYHFVAGGIDTGPQISAVRLLASTLAKCNLPLSDDLSNALGKCAAIKREDNEIKQLASIETLTKAFEKLELSLLAPEARNVRDILALIWMNLFQRYYWLLEQVDLPQ